MHQAEGAFYCGIVEVGEEAAHLGGQQHALVHDGPGAHGAHIKDAAFEGVGLLGGLLDGATTHVEGALEIVARKHRLRAPNEGLVDGGHGVARRSPQVMGVHRHLAPKEQRQTVSRATLLENADGRLNPKIVLGEEEHGHAIVALVGQQTALFLSLFAEEPMRHLHEDARAVAAGALQAHAATMLQIYQYR